MKRIFAAALLIAGTAAWAQVSNPSIVVVASAPSGSCTQNLPDQQVVGLGTIYTCQSGTWTSLGGGGGGGSSVGSQGQVQAAGSTPGSFQASSITDNGTTVSTPENFAVGSGGSSTQINTTALPIVNLPAASTVPPVTTGSRPELPGRALLRRRARAPLSPVCRAWHPGCAADSLVHRWRGRRLAGS